MDLRLFYRILGAACLAYFLLFSVCSRFGLSLSWLWIVLGGILLAAGALTIANEGGTMKHMAVVAEHPELNVTLASNYPQTMEELTTAMVSGTGSIDVFSLNTDANPVARLIDKGYAADLSGYPELMAVAGRMDARFTESVMRDGKLVGYVLLNRPDNAGMYTAMIEHGVPVASLAADTFDRVPLNIDFPQGAARMHRGYPSTLNELGWPKAEGEE